MQYLLVGGKTLQFQWISGTLSAAGKLFHAMPETDPGPDQERHAARDRPTFLRVVLAVFWSFFGVRKGRDLLADASSIKPQHLIVAGLLGAFFLVVSLLLLVRLIIKSAGA